MALRIGYGLIAAQRPPWDSRPWSEVYADAVAAAEAAEDAGFDSVWVTEHHFTDDGYLSALFPLLAAMAVRTHTVLLGTNVALAPLYQPLRLAEDAAVVATLAEGRLLLGLGIGYRDEEFAALGVAKKDRVPLLLECVDTCRAAWTGEPFGHRGQEIVVRPAPPGPPEIWTGGWVDASVRRAARVADGYISPVGDLADTERRVAMLRPEQGIATTTFAVITRDDSLPEPVRRSLAHVFSSYGDWYGSSSDDEGGSAVGRLIQAIPDPAALVLHGSSARVADALTALAARFAGEREHHLVVRMHHPGVALPLLREQIDLFAADVIPALRQAAR